MPNPGKSSLVFVLMLCAGCASVSTSVTQLDPATIGRVRSEQRRHLLAKGVKPLPTDSAWYYMDRQEARLREQLAGTGVSVARDADRIVIKLPERPAKPVTTGGMDARTLTIVAAVMVRFHSTLASISAPQGAARDAVASYLVEHGIDRDRLLYIPQTRPSPAVRFTLEPLTR